MTLTIVSRAAWGAVPPTKIVQVEWSRRTGFVEHYSDASKNQTVRSIQRYCMENKGHSDIDYNFLVDVAGVIYEGRGWNHVGSHCLNHNTATIGVCMIGTDTDVTNAAKRSIRALYDEANRRKGSKLTRYCHRDLRPTDCPGDKLCTWLKSGMPVVGGDPTSPSWTEKMMLNLPTIKRGSTDKTRVRIIQGVLNARGFGIKIDGEFGPTTEFATREMQRRFGAEAIDGIWGPETWTIGITGVDAL